MYMFIKHCLMIMIILSIRYIYLIYDLFSMLKYPNSGFYISALVRNIFPSFKIKKELFGWLYISVYIQIHLNALNNSN